jgi:glutathione S-transferase
MTSTPILYSFRRCPYAMRARMALLISGQRFEIREVVLRRKPEAMIAASAKATVPVMVLADGAVIDESIDIMRWALLRHDPEGWLAGDAPLIQTFDGRFKHHLDRTKYPERHGSDPAAHRAAGLAMLDDLEQRLAAHPNLCRVQRTLADIAIMPFVRQFAAVDQSWFDRQAVPRVRQWLARHIASPLFDQAMVRLKPWTPGDAPVIWGP